MSALGATERNLSTILHLFILLITGTLIFPFDLDKEYFMLVNKTQMEYLAKSDSYFSIIYFKIIAWLAEKTEKMWFVWLLSKLENDFSWINLLIITQYVTIFEWNIIFLLIYKASMINISFMKKWNFKNTYSKPEKKHQQNFYLQVKKVFNRFFSCF